MLVISDSNGDPVILLTKEESLPSTWSGQAQYVKTTAAILPSDAQEAEEIVESIEELTRGTGTHTEDGWFYASSVYLSSTIYYNVSIIDGFDYVSITKVTISCRVNSGTSISSMSLLMGQQGFNQYNGYSGGQTKTFNATTARTFYPPSNWVPVVWYDLQTVVAAHLTATAVRSGGSSTFTLYNNVAG